VQLRQRNEEGKLRLALIQDVINTVFKPKAAMVAFGLVGF
jgi:hypothetical protein